MEAFFGNALQPLSTGRRADIALEFRPLSLQRPTLLLEALLFARADHAEASPPYDARRHDDETNQREGDSRAAPHFRPTRQAARAAVAEARMPPRARLAGERFGNAGFARFRSARR